MGKKILIMMLLIVLVLPCMTCFCFAGSEEQISKVEDLEGKKIGVQTGTTIETIVNESLKNKEIYSFATLPDCFAAYKSGKLDAVVGDGVVVDYLASKLNLHYATIDFNESEDSFAMITAKTDSGDKLNQELNQFFRKIKSSGEMDRLIDKWVKGKEERVMKDFTLLPDINGSISVAAEVSYPPMEYIENGKVVGYEVELLYEFCKERGYSLKIENVPFSSIIAGIVSGKYDLGASGFSITEERKKSVTFTDPIIVSKILAVVPEINDEVGISANKESGIIDKIKKGFIISFVEQDRYKLFVKGAFVTLFITIISLLLGTIIGFLIYLICRNNNKVANKITGFCRWLIHGMPEVVLLMILFYIVFGKYDFSGIWVSIIAFTMIFASAMFGMLQSGEKAIDFGQKEAAYALGYGNSETYFRIILPQSAMHFLPSYKEEVISHIKATAVVGYIAVQDITKVSDVVRGATYEAIWPLLITAVLYFVMAEILITAVKIVIRAIDPKRRSKNKILKGVEGI